MAEGRGSPSVSAIIPAYNAERFVREAVESVLGQTMPIAECVVVDDGSTDETATLVRQFGPSVRLLQQENQGVSAARNRGARETSGDLLAFLDADDRWLPTRIERQLKSLEGWDAVVCGTRVVDRDGASRSGFSQGPGVSVHDMLMCRVPLVSVSSNLLIRREAFVALGGFDERLSTSADWQMMFQLVRARRVLALPDLLVEYRLHDGNMSSNIERFEQDMLNAFRGIFEDPAGGAPLRHLRRKAVANLRRAIAGSYFVQGSYGRFLSNAARSVAGHPSTFPYFLGMPFRRLRRRAAASPGDQPG